MMNKVEICRSPDRAELIRQDRTPEERQEEFIGRINQLTRLPLRLDQVYIRSMYLCSTRLCRQDWGRFTREALEEVVQMLPGKSVIVGHDRSRLPIARYFHAEVIRREDDPVDEEGREVYWVRAWFYWLRETSGARDLALNIDGGIYREVSISWRYEKATCCICSGAIQQCSHIPGRIYDGVRCTFEIEKVRDVLEGSIVYKGAEDGTGFERKLLEEERQAPGRGESPVDRPARKMQYNLIQNWNVEEAYRKLSGLPRNIQSVLFVGKRDCLPASLRCLFSRVGVAFEILNPVENVNAGQERFQDRKWDLLWVDKQDTLAICPGSAWWKRLVQRARFVLWETEAGRQREVERILLIRKYLPGPAWQLDSEEIEQTESRMFFVRENQ